MEWEQGRRCAGARLGQRQEPTVLVLSRTPGTCWGLVWGQFCLRWLRVDINPPKPQGIHGCAGPHRVAVNYLQTLLLDMNKAVGLGNMAGPAALLTSTMLPSMTLHSFSKRRIWQDRKEEMLILSFSFVFVFFFLGKPQPYEVTIHFSSQRSCTEQIW